VIQRGEDDLRVAARREAVALRLERLPELAEVVDLAVEHERQRAEAHRLVPGQRRVLDREPAHADRPPGAVGGPVIVRPAVGQRGGHPVDAVPHLAGRRLVGEHAGDPAHQAVSSEYRAA
jgi:hypothetical protein